MAERFFDEALGAGKRMVTAARAGALVVRAEPIRAYQRAEPSTTFGQQMLVADALRLTSARAVPVARDGALIGIVRSDRLTAADPGATLGSVMEPPISVDWDASIPSVARALGELGGAPVPIVGPKGQLIGAVTG
jgi:CBS domain-containing protein